MRRILRNKASQGSGDTAEFVNDVLGDPELHDLIFGQEKPSPFGDKNKSQISRPDVVKPHPSMKLPPSRSSRLRHCDPTPGGGSISSFDNFVNFTEIIAE